MSSPFSFWRCPEVIRKPREANLLNSLCGEEDWALSTRKTVFYKMHLSVPPYVFFLFSNMLLAIISIMYEESSMTLLQ